VIIDPAKRHIFREIDVIKVRDKADREFNHLLNPENVGRLILAG
jgi:hypothetical protein